MNPTDPPKPPTPFRKRSLPPLQRLLLETKGIQLERETASNVVPRILRNPDWSGLPEHSDLRTWGALEYLGNVVDTSLTRDPRYALAVAELAVAIADSLPDHAYPSVAMHQLRGLARKDLGRALRVLSRYDEALIAFRTAQVEIAKSAALAHDLALVTFNIVMALQEMGRYDESLALVPECKEVFRGHGDTDGFVRCGLAEAVLLQRLKRNREARETCLLLLASSRRISKDNLAALHLAIGYSSVDLRDFADAEANFQQAITLYKELGQPLHVSRAELGRGRLFLRRGDYALAVSHLRPVRREFLRNALSEEAGLCGLEIVEALLFLDHASAAEKLARKIVQEFTLAKLNGRAVTALAYLSDAIASNKASTGLAMKVHEYVLSLRTNPEREFTVLRAAATE